MGFFTHTELAKKAKKEIDIHSFVPQCNDCGLYKDSRTKKQGVTGSGAKRILIVGDFPSENDDYDCTQLSGEVGTYTKNLLRVHGNIVMNADCWKVNAIRCKPPEGLDIEKLSKFSKMCRPALEKVIFKLKPDYVLLLGRFAVQGVLGEAFSSYGIERWRGVFIKDEYYKTTLFATFHPRTYVTENNHDRGMNALIERDIRRFCTAVRSRDQLYTPKPDYAARVKILTDIRLVKALFERILQNELPLFFDYESTGLKPTRIGQKVVMLGIALSTDEAYAIPVKWKTIWTAQELRYIISTFRLILSNKNIRKSAHNIKFEDFWSFGFFGTRIANVEWCSMMGAHILDNRRAWSALKFQTYIQFGVRPYDDHIKHFLKSKETEFNEVEKAPFKDIAIYCGLDCIFGLMLKSDQQEQFALDQNKGMLRAFNFFKKGLGIMSEMQINGARSNIEYYTEAQEKLGKDIEALGEKLMASREARAFKEVYHREINIGSDQDIGALYFEVLKHKGLKTAKGNWKTDKLSLGRIKIDFSKDLGEYKKLTKMYDTYFKQYMSETCYGRIHPFFDLHVPISYRSSSSRPNFQNTPKRDAVAKKLIRTGIEPDPGSVLIECDFSGAEVNTSCFIGNTRIETIKGSKSIKQIIHRIKTHDVYVYGYSLEEKRIKIAKVLGGGPTGFKKEVWKVTLDSGAEIIGTPTHKFMVRSGYTHEGSYVELKRLTPGMSLMPFYKKKRNGYYYINLNNRKSIAEHTLIGIDVMGVDVGGSLDSNVIHHKDEDGLNNELDNLEFMSRSEHVRLHHKGKSMGPLTQQHKDKISKSIKGIKCPQRGHVYTKEECIVRSIRQTGKSTITPAGARRLSESKVRYWKNKKLESCAICGNKYKTISNTHLMQKHGMSLSEYRHEYNHKVVSVEFYGYEDVYNIEVEGIHNYALSAGIIVKNCAYHRDRNFYNYLIDPTTDMHRDSACDIFKLSPEDLNHPDFTKEMKKLAKKIRNEAKNKWVFAQFYGDWYDSCGRALYENCYKIDMTLPSGILLSEHMDNNGIGELEDFLEHCKEAERIMWMERFPEYTQWKKDIYEFYIKHGYIDTYLGFRFQGYMDRKAASNYPIQSTSFHLLVHTLIQVSAMIRKLRLKSKLIMQIHDSLIASVPVSEVGIYLANVNRIVENLHNVHKWMNVPMKIEADMSRPLEDGGNFNEMFTVPEPMMNGKIDLKRIYGVK